MILKFLKNKNSPSLEKGATSRQKGHFHNCCPFFFIFSLHPLAAALMDCQRTWSLFLFLAPSFSFFSPPLSAGVENLLQISFFLPLRTEKRLCPCRVHSLSLLLARSLSHTHTHTNTFRLFQLLHILVPPGWTFSFFHLIVNTDDLSLCVTPPPAHINTSSALCTSHSTLPFLLILLLVACLRFLPGGFTWGRCNCHSFRLCSLLIIPYYNTTLVS